MSESTALAVVTPDPKAEGEKLPAAETITVPAAIMLAAETVADPKGAQTYHRGVYLHSRDRRGRVVSTDGARMFIASFPVEGKMPSWMTQGVLIDSVGLKPRLSMLGKGEEAKVKVSHVKGTHRIELTDLEGDIAFGMDKVDATYPDYEKVIGADSFVDLDEDGKPRGVEWKPIGIGSGYLKHCGEIARLLDNGRPKGEREKTGMVVRAFSGDVSRPIVFDFPGWPGAVLIVMPLKLSSSAFPRETAALIAPAVKGSIAALRAHATRQLQFAKQASSDAERQAHLQKAKEFQQRISALLDTAPMPQIAKGKEKQEPEPEPEPAAEAPAPQPEAEPEPQAQPEPQAEEPQPEPEPVGGPKVTRRKVKINREAA